MKDNSNSRPLGFVLVAALDVFSISLMPMITLYITATHVELKQMLGMNFVAIISTVLLSLFVAISAFKTLKGDAKAKNTLLTLIAIYLALIAFNNLTVYFNPQQLGIEELTSQQKTTIIANIVRPSILLLINYFYFKSAAATKFLSDSK